MGVLSLGREFSQDMLTVDDVILSAYFEVMFANDLNAGIILDEFVIAPVDIIIKGHLIQVSLY